MKTIIALSVLLCGCVTSKPVTLPSGQAGYSIDCSGGEHDISDCMNKAAQVCGGAYEVLNQGESSAANGLVPVGRGAMLVAMQRRILIVGCKH